MVCFAAAHSYGTAALSIGRSQLCTLLLDHNLVQNIDIKTIENANTCSDINAAQPGYCSLARIAKTSLDLAVDSGSEKIPVSL